MPILAPNVTVDYVPTTHSIARSKIDPETWYWVGKPSWCGPFTLLKQRILMSLYPAGVTGQWRYMGADTQRLYVAG